MVYAKTDKYYVKKFEAETNLTGYLVMDLSASMAYSHEQELTKFEYSICLAAALCYLMIHQNEVSVELVAPDLKLLRSSGTSLPKFGLGWLVDLERNHCAQYC